MFTHNLSGTHVEMRSLWELVRGAGELLGGELLARFIFELRAPRASPACCSQRAVRCPQHERLQVRMPNGQPTLALRPSSVRCAQVTSKLPRLAAHLRVLSCDISILATDWFMCLFATTLPSEVRSCAPEARSRQARLGV